MDQKTSEHLQVARRNRDLAHALLDPSLAGLRPYPWEWVAVIAFYSAVHYVNAYQWEQHRSEPLNHGDRLARVKRDAQIRTCRASYWRLQNIGYQARYKPTFVVPEHDARDLVNIDLRRVEATVMLALGQPIPRW